MSRSGRMADSLDMGAVTPLRRDLGASSDAELLQAARSGDARAKEAIFRRHLRMVHGLAFRLLGPRPDVGDLVHDVFVEAFGALDRVESPDRLSSWLGGITVHLAKRRLERERFRSRFYQRRADPAAVERIWARSAAPDVVAELKALYEAVERLPPNQRLALLLHRVEGQTLEEVAERLGASLASIKRWIAAAERRLRLEEA
jgi:RNA polymerase sigma-70 factor, ECF subfamily